MNWITVEHGGKTHRVAVERTAQGVWVGWPGRAKYFGPERSEASRDAGHDEIRAPMTGKVVKVRVAVGDKVARNDVVVILEAMKMEYRLAAPHDGIVEAVLCKEGELVDLGRGLVELKGA